MTEISTRVGIVVIGRNEGERLRRCLLSVIDKVDAVVYVDSGSTDDSVRCAKGFGMVAVELDMSSPFCAARARNCGFKELVDKWPAIQYVQFIDGDCELAPEWLSVASDTLDRRKKTAAVAGVLRERNPNISIYNRIAELEWNQLGVGDVETVGGIFMIRREAFECIGGFDPSISAGEEPELCYRLTRKGWAISRLDQDMAWHDLAMTEFGQWWTRQIRGGYGALAVSRRFGLPRFNKFVQRARIWSSWPIIVCVTWWGVGQFGGPTAANWIALTLLALWPAQLARIAIRTVRRGFSVPMSLCYGFLTMISFWPQILGQSRFVVDQWRSARMRLIEYKKSELRDL